MFFCLLPLSRFLMFQKLMFLDSSKKAAIGMSCLRVFCDTMSVVKVCTFGERVKGFLTATDWLITGRCECL